VSADAASGPVEPREPASAHLVADLEKPRELGLRRILRLVWTLASSAIGSPEYYLDLVVRRRDSGAEVLRTSAGDVGDPQHLLDTVRADLDEKTVEEFVREWRVVD
jgi:hypothetical protein